MGVMVCDVEILGQLYRVLQSMYCIDNRGDSRLSSGSKSLPLVSHGSQPLTF